MEFLNQTSNYVVVGSGSTPGQPSTQLSVAPGATTSLSTRVGYSYKFSQRALCLGAVAVTATAAEVVFS